MGQRGSSAETTRQLQPVSDDSREAGRLEAGWTATVIKLIFSAWCVVYSRLYEPLGENGVVPFVLSTWTALESIVPSELRQRKMNVVSLMGGVFETCCR